MSRLLDAPVLVVGAGGLVGGGVARHLRNSGYSEVLTPTRNDLDLRDRKSVLEFFGEIRPRAVVLAAAKVGGIAANIADPVGFASDNLQIELNAFEACRSVGVEKVVFLASSCAYPRDCPQPMRESFLMTGQLEPTNEGYALAKLVGIYLAKAYRQQYGLNVIVPMPCNVYGTGDHFDLERAHVLSALVARFVEAVQKSVPAVTLWGTGEARREFIHVDDLAAAILLLLESYDDAEVINVGTGVDVTIRELANAVAFAAGYRGRIEWDPSRPDGMPRKCLDVSRLTALGFRPSVGLDEGIRRTIEEYRQFQKERRLP